MGNGLNEAQKIKLFWGACLQTPVAPRAFGARFPFASFLLPCKLICSVQLVFP